MRRIARSTVALAAAGLLLAGCGSSPEPAPAAGTGAPRAAARPSAAPSPSSPPRRSPSPSPTLGQAVRGRAPRHQGDVQLRRAARPWPRRSPRARRPTCSPRPAPRTWTQVVAAGAASAPTTFAKNVDGDRRPAGQPGQRHRAADLASPGVKVALCQPQVPCGADGGDGVRQRRHHRDAGHPGAGRQGGARQGDLGEVDAGVVYVTDVKAAGGKVKGIADPGGRQRLDHLPDRRR